MATIRDIAKKAGVSVGTASRSLTGNGYVAEETRQLVLETARELGYQQKERLRPASTSRTVGIVLPDVTFPFYGAFLKYAEIELANCGYQTCVCNTLGVQDRVGRMLKLLEKHELDGLILNADVTAEDVRRMEKLPVISFERMLGSKIPMVSSDHRQGGRFAAEEFLKSGCSQVLILTARHGNPLYGDCRIEECRKILEQNGTKVTIAEIPPEMLSFRYGMDIAEEYLTLYHQADGVFTDDAVAYCILAYAQKKKIPIPEKLKIIGYDGNEIGLIIHPQITTVLQDVPRITKTCVEQLMLRIRRQPVPERTLIPVSFRKGGST